MKFAKSTFLGVITSNNSIEEELHIRYNKTLSNGEQEAIQLIVPLEDARFFKDPIEEFGSEYQSGKKVALEISNDKVTAMRAYTKSNLFLGTVSKLEHRAYHAIVDIHIGKVFLLCSDYHGIEPSHDDAINLEENQQVLIGVMHSDNIRPYKLLGFVIEQLYDRPFRMDNKLGFISQRYGRNMEMRKISNCHKKMIHVDEFAQWMQPGIWFIFEERPTTSSRKVKRYVTDIGWVPKYTSRDDIDRDMICHNYQCIGKIYDFKAITTQTTFYNVPCVLIKLYPNSKCLLWNDYLGVIECGTLTCQLFDVVYLTVVMKESSIGFGTNASYPNEYEKMELQASCSQMLRTGDFEVAKADEYYMVRSDGEIIVFQVNPANHADEGVKYLRITYYYDGETHIVLETTAIEEIGQEMEEHPLYDMSGIRRNPNICHEVDKSGYKIKEIGYISSFSHSPNTPFEVTLMDGTVVEFTRNMRRDWMDFGTFLTVSEDNEPCNRGKLFDVSSKGNKNDLVVKVIGDSQGYTAEVFGDIRVNNTRKLNTDGANLLYIDNIRYDNGWIGDIIENIYWPKTEEVPKEK